MKRTIQIRTLSGEQEHVTIESVPDFCPLCHTSVLPLILNGIKREMNSSDSLRVVFQCPDLRCQELFVGYYAESYPSNYLRRVAPIEPLEAQFSEVINEASPTFVEVYNQAIAAESANLSQIVGMGLRKALEFLVKDFAIREHPDQDEDIRKAPLARCIKEYIKDPNVKECAKRAAWLGNDETHYTRRWLDKDLKDLKLLIRLTVNWVENAILTEKYIDDMTDPSAA